MQPHLQRKFFSRVDESDWTLRTRPVTLLNWLQDAAFLHAAELGVGVTDLLDQHLTWVLTRYRIHFLSYPSMHQEVTVRTWPSSREGRTTTRDFEVMAGNGDLLAVATSAWALLDLQSRRPVRLSEILPDYPMDTRRALDFSPERLPAVAQASRELSFRVRLGDLDLNRHVNNAVYVQWALEAVPAAIAEHFRPVEIEVAYRAEALLGDTVLSRLRPMAEGAEPLFVHQLFNRDDDREFARMRSRWLPSSG